MNLEKKYEEIKKKIEKGEHEPALESLAIIIEENPDEDNAYYLRGNIYRKQQDWQNAINNYTMAIELNPESPAVGARKMCIEILNFFNTDLYNH